MIHRVLGIVLLVAVLSVVLASPASACAVCYGESDSAIAKGADLSILFMAILTYTLIVGGLVAFIVHMSRARRAAESAGGREESEGAVGPSSIGTSPAG